MELAITPAYSLIKAAVGGFGGNIGQAISLGSVFG